MSQFCVYLTVDHKKPMPKEYVSTQEKRDGCNCQLYNHCS